MINRIHEDSSTEEKTVRMIIGLAMKIHRTLGCGFLELIYANALVVELEKAGIAYETEKKYAVVYEGVEIGYFAADLVVEGRLIIELKAVEALSVAHSVQLVNYLAVSQIEEGLLLNFGRKSLEFKTKNRVYRAELEAPDLQP